MHSGLPLKNKLLKKCTEHIDQRIQMIEETLSSVQDSRNNETKSSVGDKYETGRAMMQLEEEKNQSQLAQAIAVKNELLRIDISMNSLRVSSGSLVFTTKGTYFISIGIGKVLLRNNIYYCISSKSPIGNQLIGKKVGDEIEFNENKIRITEIW